MVSMSVSFTDQDFDADELGGTVYFSSSGWVLPGSSTFGMIQDVWTHANC